MWLIFAIGSAVFAALTSILAKIGIEGVGSNLATAIRTLVVVAMAWVMVFITNQQSGLAEISKRSWIFLILSGLATGLSWICYYKALQLGQASKVVPIDKMSGLCIFARTVYLEVNCWLLVDYSRYFVYGVVGGFIKSILQSHRYRYTKINILFTILFSYIIGLQRLI